MAEKRDIIIDVELEDKDFDKEIGQVNTQLRKNREEIKELSKDYNKNSEAIAKLEAENRDLSKSKQQLIKESKTESNSLAALRLKTAELTKERNNLDTSTKEGAKRFQELNKEIKSNTDELKEAEEAGGDFRRNVGDYGSALDSVIPGISGFTQGIQNSTRAALAFIATPLGLILGGIALAISAVTAAFKDSEEGQNKFAKIMGVIGVVTGNFRDLLADLGEFIIDAFENPQESIRSFANLIRDNIVNRFEGLIELIPALGESISLLFRGQFAEAGEVALNAVAKVSLGIEDITGKVREAGQAIADFTTQTINESNQAVEVAEKRAQADILSRELLVERAKIESEIAALRLRARQEDEVSAEQRKQALLDAQVLEDQLLEKEKEVLKLRADAQTLENSFSRSTKENLDTEAEAIAAVSRVEATRLNQQRQTQRELNRINKEILRNQAAEAKAVEDKFKRQEKALQEFLDKQSKEEQKAFEESKKREETLANLRRELGEKGLAEFTGFIKQGSKVGRAAALLSIGQDTAEAIAALTAASEGNPANFFTFGAAGVAQFAAGLLRIGVNIARAKKALDGGGSIPGAGGSGRGGGSDGTRGTFGGGDLGARAPGFELSSSLSEETLAANQNVAAVQDAIRNQPAPQVAVTDINTAQSNRQVVVEETRLTQSA